ncbi:hypothetical protein [Roseibium aggregatum]|uniref:Uncharacterized protein n=1 Tax=Roseibium aggregatum TaxID=187304 RepID=A0A0M6Y9M4_9HYPH|nr:hypothetical protein [Roseibium aggregatum]CTQ45701.1 hypothetical protein LAL4801_04156 [Roseibium aggregatum]
MKQSFKDKLEKSAEIGATLGVCAAAFVFVSGAIFIASAVAGTPAFIILKIFGGL